MTPKARTDGDTLNSNEPQHRGCPSGIMVKRVKKDPGGAMGLKDKWTAARERDRQVLEAERARQRRYNKAGELQKLGVPAMTADGWPNPELTEEALDEMLMAEKQRRVEMYETFSSAKTVTAFWALGVQVLADDKVYTVGKHDQWAKTNSSRLLGLLAGAEAKVTEGTSAFSWGKAMIMPIATAPLARKETADALVVFPDGTVHMTPLDGSNAVREARKQAVQFNTLAGSFTSAVTEPPIDPAAKLRKLQELRDAGLLSQEEYEVKRTQVIDSI
jgi:hypothetical protein